MATSPAYTNRLFDGGINFLPGVNSFLNPSLIDPSAWSWAINTVSSGGQTVCRPGFHSVLRLLDGKAQGFTIFQPLNNLPFLVAAVSGEIWVSAFPFVTVTKLANVKFSPDVDHITFKIALKSADKGLPIDPYLVLLMQDGTSRAAYWDGSISRHLDPGQNETPQGLAMEWIGSRLWVARGNQIFAGDIDDPLSFTENTYLAAGGSFQPLDGLSVTCLCKTADNKALIAFTLENATLISANITDRSQWKTTIDFISILFPGVGCVGPKAFNYLNGELWWMSKEGGRRFTQVSSTIQVSRNSVASVEMQRSFVNIRQLISRTCVFSFGTTVGLSVPSGDIYNRHTWVFDSAPESLVVGEAGPAWQGIWMGTRPVEWASADIEGTERCFHLSQDRDGAVRIWEAFEKDQLDDGGLIFCSLEGPGLLFKEPLSFKRFSHTEVHLTGLLGQSPMTVEYRSEYSCWKKIMDLILCATDCRQLSCDYKNTGPTPQNRYIVTQEAKHNCESAVGPYSDDIGTYFQNRFRWYGRNGIYKYRSHVNQWEEKAIGACMRGDVSPEGLIQCKPLFCCDQEVDYISRAKDHGYVYGSSNEFINSL